MLGEAGMVIIGTGRGDPRRWVKTAYAIVDLIESGQAGPRRPVPSKPELAARLGVSQASVQRAFRELAEMGIVHRVDGHGYYPRTGNHR